MYSQFSFFYEKKKLIMNNTLLWNSQYSPIKFENYIHFLTYYRYFIYGITIPRFISHLQNGSKCVNPRSYLEGVSFLREILYFLERLQGLSWLKSRCIHILKSQAYHMPLSLWQGNNFRHANTDLCQRIKHTCIAANDCLHFTCGPRGAGCL